jgi:hypothetical protein
MNICTDISNEMKITSDQMINGVYENFSLAGVHEHEPYNQSVSLAYIGPAPYGSDYKFRFNISTITNNANNGTQQYMDNTDVPLSIPSNSLFLSFKSLQTFIGEDIIASIDGIQNKPAEAFDIETGHFLLYLGQAYIISFKPIVYIHDYELGLTLDLNLQLEQIPIKLESNQIQLEIYSRSDPCTIIRYEGIRTYDCKYIRLCLKFF